MPKSFFVIALGAIAIFSGVSSHTMAQTFGEPKYVEGTTFELRHVRENGDIANRKLIFKGTTTSSDRLYDFGEYTMSSSLVYAPKKRKRVSKRVGVKFPFSLGDTWRYEYSFEATTLRDCGRITRSFEATVAKSMHQATVAGEKLDVIGIHHEGKWECSDTNAAGRFIYDYEFSPRLGMYVSETWTNFRPNGYVYRKAEKKLVGFHIPTK